MARRAKKILWCSRHHPDEGKIRELRRLFGEVEVVIDDRPISQERGADDVLGRVKSGRFDEIVLVAPTSVLDGLCQRGVKPLWPKISDDRRTFLSFERVNEIRKKFEDVQPVEGAAGRKVLWLSRFDPQPGRQVSELKRLFGDDMTVHRRDIPNVERVNEEFSRGGYDAIVAIVPEAVFERLSAAELPLIRAETPREQDPAKIEWSTPDGRGFRFDRYVWYRIERVVTRL